METRWLSLGGSLLMESVAGSSYALSVYGPQLKALLNLTQAQLNTVGSAGNIGSYSVIESGFLFDAYGPVPTGLVGATLSALGYAALWAAATGRLPGTTAMLAAATFCWSHGSSFLDVCAVSTSIRNFPHDRGRVIGLTKSLYGISASVLVLCYSSLYKPDVVGFLRFLAVLIATVAAASALGIRLAPVAHTSALTRLEKAKLWVAMGGVVALAAYVTALSLLQSSKVVDDAPVFAYVLPALIAVQLVVAAPPALTAAVMGLCVASDDDGSGGGVGGKAPQVPARASGNGDAGALGGTSAPLLSDGSDGDERASITAPAAPVGPREGATFVQGALTVDMLLIGFYLFSATGAGLCIINNLGSITQSLGARECFASVTRVCVGRSRREGVGRMYLRGRHVEYA